MPADGTGAGVGNGVVDGVVDAVLALLADLAGSPWVYALVFGAVVLDAFLPLVPSETVVITAGVFATGGAPDALLVIAVAAGAAFVGDLVGYRIGQGAGRLGARLATRLGTAHRGRPPLVWAERQLRERGGVLLVGSRFVPGGRTATTLAAGVLGYPRRRFAAAVALASVAWAVYATSLGLLGAALLDDRPGVAILVGLGVAATVTVVAETWRRTGVRRQRRDAAAAQPAPDPEPEPVTQPAERATPSPCHDSHNEA